MDRDILRHANAVRMVVVDGLWSGIKKCFWKEVQMAVYNSLLIPTSLDVRIECFRRNLNVECIGEEGGYFWNVCDRSKVKGQEWMGTALNSKVSDCCVSNTFEMFPHIGRIDKDRMAKQIHGGRMNALRKEEDLESGILMSSSERQTSLKNKLVHG